MARVVLAIGGSGQMILHHYVQQFLTGIVKEPFEAFILDTDRCSESLRWLAGFFEDVARAVGPEDAKKDVPVLRFIPLKPERETSTVAEVLMQAPVPSQPGFHHPAQAFFSRNTLEQQVGRGLYARPALSAVVAVHPALREIQPERFARNTTVVVVSSCIGGTGGGMSVPVLWRLARAQDRELLLHGVFLGDYFQPNRQLLIEDQIPRFRSNRLVFLKALKESIRELRAFTFIEEPKMESRDPQAEQQARNLPWADEDYPYWRATSAIEFLFRETVKDVSDKFEERELEAGTFAKALRREECWQRLRRSTGRVEALFRHRILDHIAKEAPVEAVWGAPLVTFLASYWKTISKAGGTGPLTPEAFVRGVQAIAEGLWRDPRRGYGLSRVFPVCDEIAPRVEELRRVGWPIASDTVKLEEFRGQDAAMRGLASLLLFSALRYGA